MAKRKVARKSTARRTHKRGMIHRIPEKHHDRVIVYGGILAIVLTLVATQML